MKTIDDIYDDLNAEQQSYVDSILGGKHTIKGLYYDKYYKNGGWNGMMDAISEFEKMNNIERPNFDDLEEDVSITEMLMEEF